MTSIRRATNRRIQETRIINKTARILRQVLDSRSDVSWDEVHARAIASDALQSYYNTHGSNAPIPNPEVLASSVLDNLKL